MILNSKNVGQHNIFVFPETANLEQYLESKPVRVIVFYKRHNWSGNSLVILIIIATQEVEIRRIKVPSQP
jgi:hypothetical protein